MTRGLFHLPSHRVTRIHAAPAPALVTALCLAVALPIGCASALKEPPSLDMLGGGGAPAEPGIVGELLEQAGILYAERSLERVWEARNLWLQAARADATRIEGLIGAARASAWLAEHESAPDRRLRAAEVAVQAGQWCERIAPEEPACAYWLGAGLGLQARERKSTALDALPRIVETLLRAARAAPSLERGGPDRALAMVYVRAPGWPTGPGDPDLGVEHARKAVELDPLFPPNLLVLGEALAAIDDDADSREAYRSALEAARAAEAGGDPDAPEWIREAETALEDRG